MIREQFFADPDDGYAKVANKAEFDYIWKTIQRAEKTTGLSLDNCLTREQYITFLNAMKIRKSRRLVNIKGIICPYLRYLVANGVLPPDQDKIPYSVLPEELSISVEGKGVQYFRDIDTLAEAIRRSIEISADYDESVWDVPVAILYLAWYGLTEQEIVDYLKKDVYPDCIIIHGEKVYPPKDVLRVFTRLRHADGYYQQARGLIFRTYVPSEYLIRSIFNGHLDVVSIRGAVYRLNKVADQAYSLSYCVVYQSGIFQRLYQMECAGRQFDLNDPEEASEAFHDDLYNKQRRGDRIQDYNLYKQLYTSAQPPLPSLDTPTSPKKD